MIANKTARMLVLKCCATKAKPLHWDAVKLVTFRYPHSTANVLPVYLTFYFPETFLVPEIDNVIDIEDDLFWQCINAPHVRNNNTKL